MNKKILLSVLIAFLDVGLRLHHHGHEFGDPDVTRRSLDANADAALSRSTHRSPGSEQMVRQARGVLVFPVRVRGGFAAWRLARQGVLRVGGRDGELSRHDEWIIRLCRPAPSRQRSLSCS